MATFLKKKSRTKDSKRSIPPIATAKSLYPLPLYPLPLYPVLPTILIPPSCVPSVTPLSLVPLLPENNPVLTQFPVDIFEEARGRVIGEIDSIVESLNDKKGELLAEIGSLEREFLDRQREKQNDINKLNTLISHTEELGQNTLLDLQQKVIQEMRQEMDKLKLDSKQEPDYRIGIKWGSGLTREQLIQAINKSTILAVKRPICSSNEGLQFHGHSSIENTSNHEYLPLNLSANRSKRLDLRPPPT